MNKKIFYILTIFMVISLSSIISLNVSADPLTDVRITLLNQNPLPATIGDTADLTFSVENFGSSVTSNVQIELLSEYPFTALGDSLKDAGILYGYQTGNNHVSLTYKIMVDKEVKTGTYDLKYRYKIGGVAWVEKTIPISVSSQTFAQLIYIDRSTLMPGKETNVTFKITNTGNAPLQNMLFSWSESNSVILPVHSDNSRYIKYLDTGASVDLNYIVIADVNTKPGLYSIDMNLNYQSVNNVSTSVIKSKAGMFIGGETDFDVAFSQSSQGQTSLSVSNVGNTPAQSVSVRIPMQQNYRISGTDTSIIGNLDKGDYTLVSFQITANTNSSGRNFTVANLQRAVQTETSQGYQQGFQRNMTTRTGTTGNQNGLRVLIDYTDTTGERRTVEKFV